MIVSLFAFALSVAPVAVAETDRDLLAPGNVVLVGEQHGTQEIPAFFLDLVKRAVATDRPLVVGLEFPESERERMEAFLGSPGDAPSRARLIAGGRWQADNQYGLTSEAMFALLDGLRVLRADGHAFGLVLFDRSGEGGARARDRRMAEHLAGAIAAAPADALTLVLTGNIHSRVARGTRWDAEFEPMGYRLAQRVDAARIVTLDVAHTGGTSWACLGPAPEDCGVQSFAARGPREGEGITLDGSPETTGHHGWYRVGAIHASAPARDAGAAGTDAEDAATVLWTFETGG